MSSDTLNEREFELVNIVGAQLGSNQRDLSRRMELSLGMVNMLLRRLVSKGYIRIRQLNKRKVEYILTPKGFTEKMRKSVKYTLKTITSLGLIRARLKEVLIPLIEKGERNFTILGESDFAVLVEMILKDISSQPFQIKHLKETPQEKISGTLLICQEVPDLERFSGFDHCVNLVEEIAKDYINHQNKELSKV